MAYHVTVQPVAQKTTAETRQHTVAVHSYDRTIDLTLDDQALSIDWRQLAPLIQSGVATTGRTGGRWSLLLNSRSYEVYARRLSPIHERERIRYEITINGHCFEVTAIDERLHMLEDLTAASGEHAQLRLTAPLPGLVVRVLTEVGATVRQGETLVILEAMKMENDLTAPVSGTITVISVAAGQTVDQGAVLLQIEGTSA